MALKIYEKFAPRANVGDTNYPNGSIKNESAPGANDGTPLDADWGNDYAGFDAALFAEAGITPSGDPDTVLSSQRLDALIRVTGNVTRKYNPATIQDAINYEEWDVNGGEIIRIQEDVSGEGGGGFWKLIPTGTTPNINLPDGVRIIECVGVPGLSIYRFNSGYRVQPGYNGTSFRFDAPNVIAGHSKNAISPDVHSATISGGGLENKENVIGGIAANVNTETSNVPVGGPTTGQESKFALIGGGYDNVCNGLANVITVGQHCVIDLPADHGSIHGGSHNKILEGSYNTIGGGTRNTVYSDGFSVIAGGGDGWIGTVCTHGVVSGGSLNEVYASFSTISGGQQNLVAATSPTSSIGGGSGNETRQGNSTIAGGNGNLVDSTGQGSSVGGGINNTVNGQCATVTGGRENEAVKDYSQASGYQSKAERAGQESFANGQFFVRGDAQTSRVILKGNTSGIQTTTLEDLSGGVDFPNKTKIGIGYSIRLVAHDTGSDNENAVIILEGMASKGASGNWVINSFADKTVSTTSLALVAAEIFNSVGSLRVKVTGVAGASLNWVANIEYTENVG